jgi:hypothetical protein
MAKKFDPEDLVAEQMGQEPVEVEQEVLVQEVPEQELGKRQPGQELQLN